MKITPHTPPALALSIALFVLSFLTIGCDDKENLASLANGTQNTATSDDDSDSETESATPTNNPMEPVEAPADLTLTGSAWSWIADPRFTLVFNNASAISGNLNCKTYQGVYASDQNGQIRFPQALTSADTTCADSLASSEAFFRKALSLTKAYTIEDGVLMFDAGDLSTRFIQQ